MNRIWLAAPTAAMRLWPDDPKPGWRINDAAQNWGRQAGVRPGRWSEVAAELYTLLAGRPGDRGALGAVSMRWEAVSLAQGWLVWLTPATPPEAHNGSAERPRPGRVLRDGERAQRAGMAKSAFLARVSHELRTPLNAVLGFAQLIEHDAGADAAVQLERVGQIRIAGQHLLALVDDALDLAAIESGGFPAAPGSVDVDTVLREVAQAHRRQAWLAQVQLHVASQGGRIRGEAGPVRQLVSCLVGNAIKFNRPGGNVWISSGPASSASPLQWSISVRDDGPGLEPGQSERLLEVFARPAAAGRGMPGAGLGLTIAARLTESMQGRIEVESEAGEGSEFRLLLPAAPGWRGPAETSKSDDRPPLSLLYIEDNPVNALLVRELVGMRPDLRLECAENGATGVHMAQASRPDIVLVDMQLPDFDGFEVLLRLQADPSLDGQIRIALSANSHGEDIARARACGFDDYWTKPIDFAHFLGSMDELVQRLRAKGGGPRSAA